MTGRPLRKRGSPIAALTLLAFVSSLLTPSLAWAEERQTPEVHLRESTSQVDQPNAPSGGSLVVPRAPTTMPVEDAPKTRPTSSPDTATASSGPASADGPLPSKGGSSATPVGIDLPANKHGLDPAKGGGDHTGVSSQSISVPQGAAKIQGMGESFSAQLSTGIGTFNVPFSLPSPRGAASVSLGLSYSSSAGHGVAGMGWDVGVPAISRQTDRGAARYLDKSAWHPGQDRFVFNGGQELVPICTVQGESCTGAINGEEMPTWADGWQYFRPRVEGAFLRFFWSADHKTWRVQDKSGVLMELGLALDGRGDESPLESDPANKAHVFKWNLARQVDAMSLNGDGKSFVNPIVYHYRQDAGMSYLEDVFDTSPATSPTSTELSKYAHHTRLVYEARPDPTTSYRRGWATSQALRLSSVDVASKTFKGGIDDARKMVRRYHLSYDGAFHTSLLTGVVLEGRCGADITSPTDDPETGGVPEDNQQHLPVTTGCPSLPAMKLAYSHVAAKTADGSPGVADLVGYEGFDERLIKMANSPDSSLNDGKSGLFDINADALPDVLVTQPASFGDCHGVFFQGANGAVDSFSASAIAIDGVNGDNATVLTFNNPNLAPLDVDGDGLIDLLHMPQVKTYAVYTPITGKKNSCAPASTWHWQGRAVPAAAANSAKIDFTGGGTNIRVMDVDGDGLVDVVRSTGTTWETYFSLGRFPGGDGQFGHGSWTGPTTATLSNDPVSACVPWAGQAVQLSDPDVHVGDMNGDGYPDIVRIRKGDIKYWPGRGDGTWTTGSPAACVENTFTQELNVAMAKSPFYTDLDGSEIRLDDVNGDGLDDLVQVRANDVDIWLNVDGIGWTPNRHVLDGTPPVTALTHRVRLVDMNGSGTRDIVWGEGLDYKYIDLSGGIRPWLLTHVENGLGKSTDITYASSVSLMLAAAKTATPWASVLPFPVHVVTQSTEHDNLPVGGEVASVYTTNYDYRDPVYDGRQREFRGFRHASMTHVGDSNSPTSVSESTFLLGECVGAGSGAEGCAVWQDNPREGLKGLPVVGETHDTAKAPVYLATEHTSYTLRKLYAGLDGRAVRHAFVSATDHWAYDTGGFVATDTKVASPPTDVTLDPPDAKSPVTTTLTSIRAAGAAHTGSQHVADLYGNALKATDRGCIDGCTGLLKPDESITTTTIPKRPDGDTTRWLWRTVESYVWGSAHPTEMRRHTKTSYAPNGLALNVSASFSDGLSSPTLRFHQDLAASLAPSPTTMTPYGVDSVVAASSYDAFGHVIAGAGADGRCREMKFDPAYSELVTTETIYAGSDGGLGLCGGGVGDTQGIPASMGKGDVPLETSAVYDRGLEQTVQVIDVHGEPTAAIHDRFGRMRELWLPDPSTPSALSKVASVLIDYQLPDVTSGPFSRVHSRTQDGASTYLEAWAFIDGLGRTRVTLQEADPSAGDGGTWIVSGLQSYDTKGAPRRAFRSWFTSVDPLAYPLKAPSPAPYGTQRYDAFGRAIESFHLDGSIILKTVHHALSQDAYDAADIAFGPHHGTYASVRLDGHGRSIATTERIHVGGKIEQREVQTTYLSTGVPEAIVRTRGGDKVLRWMRYDSHDRMLLNVDPNTTANFTANLSASDSTLKAWRYAYNVAGDLVATSDARGCGVNYTYDAGGRILYEDYSPCQKTQATYSPPDTATRFGMEVAYFYDAADPGLAEAKCAFDPSLFKGRLAGVYDRGARTLTSFDGRGRSTCVARQIAKPAGSADSLDDRYAQNWFRSATTYDAADRPIAEDTGTDAIELVDMNGKSQVTTAYSGRGVVKSITSTYGSLITSVVRDADGLVQHIEYGDLAKTTTDYSYDTRRRVSSVQTYRGPPSIWKQPGGSYVPAPDWSGPPSTLQLLLEDLDYSYDEVDNPISIHDYRVPSEWPAGAQPVSRGIAYDDLYRVTRVDYSYKNGPDSWTSPFAAEDAATSGSPSGVHPPPHSTFSNRVAWQTFAYDWLGNTLGSDDDAHGFFDRSLGTIKNDAAKPYQLTSATNEATGSPSSGHLASKYDDAGNLVELKVTRAGICTTSAACTQTYRYQWDEVGRLVVGNRWDVDLPSSGGEGGVVPIPAASVASLYDVHDQRVVKSALVDGASRTTAYVFESLELRDTEYDGDGETYGTQVDRQAVYLFGGAARLAHVTFGIPGAPEVNKQRVHVFLELADHLGSTSLIVDRDTSELVEAQTYLPCGAAETDYRPARWEAFREAYGFTGKEADVEVGLTYFGKRFLSAFLGRWISADPLAVHDLGGGLNLYAYVDGEVYRSTDPVGLEPKEIPVDFGASGIGRAVPSAAGDKGFTTSSSTQYDQFRQNASVEFVNSASGIDKGYAGVLSEMAKGSSGGDPWTKSDSDAGCKIFGCATPFSGGDPGGGGGKSSGGGTKTAASELMYAGAILSGTRQDAKAPGASSGGIVGGTNANGLEGKGWQAGMGVLNIAAATGALDALAAKLLSTSLRGLAAALRAVAPEAANIYGAGFKTFGAFKRAAGPAGAGHDWHHIVEKSSANVKRFGPEAIHNTENLVRMPKAIHSKISGFYASKRPFSGGMTVREWLSKQPYEFQREFGMRKMKDFGFTP